MKSGFAMFAEEFHQLRVAKPLAKRPKTAWYEAQIQLRERHHITVTTPEGGRRIRTPNRSWFGEGNLVKLETIEEDGEEVAVLLQRTDIRHRAIAPAMEVADVDWDQHKYTPVMLRGRLVSYQIDPKAKQQTLVLEDNGVRFRVEVLAKRLDALEFEPDGIDRLRVSGVVFPPTEFRHAFTVRTNHAGDVEVLRRHPPTAWKVALASAGILSLLWLLSLAWVRSLRSKVAERTSHLTNTMAQLHSTYNAITDGMVAVDTNSRVLMSNQGFAELFGSEPAIGSDASQLCLSIQGLVDEESRARLIATHDYEPNESGEFEILLEHSDPREVIVLTHPILRDSDNEAIGRIWVFRDITENRRLAAARATAEVANKAKSEFLARMSHEIRPPMNAVMGYADALRKEMVRDERERREFLETIYGSGEHLLTVINDILDLSKIEADKLEIHNEPSNAANIMDDLSSTLRLTAEEKGLSLKTSYAEDLPIVLIDPTRLRQILLNLISNAIKFTHEGSVSVECHYNEINDRLEVSITDTGIGMSREQLERVFDPFTQADNLTTREFGGTGLGLAISTRLASLMGGSLSATSHPGEGSCFRLRVPAPKCSQGTSVSAAKQNLSIPKESLAGRRILVVDDAEANRRLISMYFEQLQAHVDTAPDGETALITAFEENYDVVFMDMQMPRMDGISATAELRKRGYDGPIVALSANAMDDDRQSFLQAGCDGFVAKPFRFQELINIVNSLSRGD